jgi:hypothetical protein
MQVSYNPVSSQPRGQTFMNPLAFGRFGIALLAGAIAWQLFRLLRQRRPRRYRVESVSEQWLAEHRSKSPE